jgi:hypothetical protein
MFSLICHDAEDAASHVPHTRCARAHGAPIALPPGSLHLTPPRMVDGCLTVVLSKTAEDAR